MRTIIALMLMTAPALAGQAYCHPEMTYHIEEIPHGYAIVRVSQSDFCKQDIMTDSSDYICDGRADYVLQFEKTNAGLRMTQDGRAMEFTRCE